MYVCTDTQSALCDLVNESGLLIRLNGKITKNIEVSPRAWHALFNFINCDTTFFENVQTFKCSFGSTYRSVVSRGACPIQQYYTGSVFGTAYIHSEMEFAFSLSIEGIISINLSSKYANGVCRLSGNFNSDATNGLVSSDTQESLGPEQFRHIWRSGHSLWCVEGCQGGTCPKCSSWHLISGPSILWENSAS